MSTYINHKYGKFNKKQFNEYKMQLRKKVFWLILYTDPKTNSDYNNVDVVSYQQRLMEQIAGMNSLLFYPVDIIDLLIKLEAALLILKNKENFDFREYRKLVLDAGDIIENMKVGD